MVIPTKEQVAKLAPRVKPIYLDAFTRAEEVFTKYGIAENALRVAHFMAQALHETGGFTILTESLSYSSPERLMAVWPSRFKTRADGLPFVKNPRALANKVYGGRMGNIGPDDGWKYIGRGIIQMTGKESYTRIGNELGVDLVGNPDLALDPRYLLAIAANEWKRSGCNAHADRNDLKAVTKAINGGYIGIAERQAWFLKTKEVWK